MKYILLIYGDPAAEASLTEEQMQQVYQAHEAYGQALQGAGVLRGGAELKPPTTATTVRFAGGKTTLVDGPFAETKEHLGGYYLIEAADLESAITFASQIPDARTGTVEIRPVMEFS